ncbi:MAG: hypothetical protein ABEI53_00225 [Candidatus Magasanikbacteria bacterium]
MPTATRSSSNQSSSISIPEECKDYSSEYKHLGYFAQMWRRFNRAGAKEQKEQMEANIKNWAASVECLPCLIYLTRRNQPFGRPEKPFEILKERIDELAEQNIKRAETLEELIKIDLKPDSFVFKYSPHISLRRKYETKASSLAQMVEDDSESLIKWLLWLIENSTNKPLGWDSVNRVICLKARNALEV